MTFRPTLLQLTALVMIALTCSTGAVLAATSTPPPSCSGTGTPPCPSEALGPDPPLPVRFDWPLAPPHPVVRPFTPPATPYGPGHRGVDLGAQPDAPVLAAGDGVVVYAGQVVGRGVVSIDHANGVRTTYEPVAVLVTAGQRVAVGTPIGHLTSGHDGCTETCLHWGAKRGKEYVDPLGLLSSGRVRLLPWDGGAAPG